MTDLLSMVVLLQPQDEVQVPAYLGRAVYAQALRWIAQADPDLAQRWHDENSAKPLTCSSLIGGKRASGGMRTLTPDDAPWFRITALTADTCAALVPLITAPPETVELDRVTFRVRAITIDPAVHPWANSGRHEALAVPYLLGGAAPPRRIALRFSAPVSFRQRERGVPLPLPELVFGGLADRWNTFSPVAISAEVRAFSESGIGMSGFRLRSRALPVKEGVVQVGAVGVAGYSALRYDRYWLSMVALLADYAFYAGVGRMTTMGMGQARRIG